MDIVKREISDFVGIAKRFKKKDFSGNEGRLIKNSSLQITTSLVAKFGSLIFTVIIARLMMPEIYGLYGLSLSTILIIAAFSDVGISKTLITFISKNIDKNPSRARGYFYLLTKYRIFLIICCSFFLILISRWVAYSYYNKPIYYALLAGAIYLPSSMLSSYLNSIFISKNNFRPQLAREIIVQLLKITIVPLTIIYFLKEVSTEIYLFWAILSLSFCYAVGGAYMFIVANKSHPFKKSKAEKLSKKERKGLIKFMVPLSLTFLSGVFFGYIDQVMLGHYVTGEFIGYYQAAFNLAVSASMIIAFSANAVFPIFARLKGKRLERGFVRTRNITLLVSIISSSFIFFIAPFSIRAIYGQEYLPSIIYLQLFSLLLISFPMINLYATYYTSQKKTKLVSIALLVSTLINIILNYILINIGIEKSMSYAAIGACLATIISRYFYLSVLVFWRRK